MPKKSININDTSLFAELVKGSKLKREKVLKEILSETNTTATNTPASTTVNSNNNSNNNNETATGKTATENQPPLINNTNGDLKDIPVPPANGIPMILTEINEVDGMIKHQQPPLPPLPSEAPAVISRKVTELPMPPGVIVPMDLKTPSPPKEAPLAGPSKKIKLTELPMPPTVPGTEDLSDDENDASLARKVNNKIRGNGTAISVSAKIQRPKIINRRLSRGPDGDWGERCVEVFQIIAQIGEGK